MMRGANPRPNIAQQGTGAVPLPEAPIDSAAPKFVIVPFQMIGAPGIIGQNGTIILSLE